MSDMFTPEDSMARAVLDACRKDVKAVHYTWSGGVTVNGKDIPFFQIIRLHIHRDFLNNYADIIDIDVMMDVRKYYDYVVKNLDNLEVYIRCKQMAENSNLFVFGGRNEYKKYKAILYNPPIQGLAGDKTTGMNQITNPDQSAQTATFQLMYKPTLELRQTKWSGMLEKTTAENALKIILSATSDGAILDKAMKISGVQMVPSDVTDPRDIIVPFGTSVVDTPQLLQQNYGIYNFGIGAYLFDKNWFVYPLFNLKRFQKENIKLSISVISKKYDVAGSPRTYFVDNGLLSIVTTEATQIAKNAPADQLNNGTGVQVANPPEERTQGSEKVGPNQVKLNGNQMSIYETSNRGDKLANPLTVYKNTTNVANLLSSVVGNNGTYMTVSWVYANPDLLYPGMPVKVYYAEAKRKEVYGVLHEYHVIHKRATDQIHDAPFICSVMMKIYVEVE